MGEEFDIGWFDEDSTTDAFHVPERNDELGLWVDDNKALWELGVKLATTAMHYQQECASYPFYRNGLFSPN